MPNPYLASPFAFSSASANHPDTTSLKVNPATPSSSASDQSLPIPVNPNALSGTVPSKKTRSTWACDVCRRKRTKCSGNHPCDTCLAFGFDCTFTRQQKKRGPPRRGDTDGPDVDMPDQFAQSAIVRHTIITEPSVPLPNNASRVLTERLGTVETLISRLISAAGSIADEGPFQFNNVSSLPPNFLYRVEAMQNFTEGVVAARSDDWATEAQKAAKQKRIALAQAILRKLLEDQAASTWNTPTIPPNMPQPSRFEDVSSPPPGMPHTRNSESPVAEPNTQSQSSRVRFGPDPAESKMILRRLNGNDSEVTMIEDLGTGQVAFFGATSNAYVNAFKHSPRSRDGVMTLSVAMGAMNFNENHRLDVPPCSPELIYHFVHLYFAHVHPFYPFIHRSHFMRQLRNAQTEPFSFLLNAMCALVTQQVKNLDSWGIHKPSDLHKAFFERARILLGRVFDAPNIIVVQGLVLLALVGHGTNMAATAYQYIGIAARHAMELGMHRDVSRVRHPGLSDSMKETMRRTWMALYIVDRYTSLIDGRPMAISDDDWDTPLVSPTMDTDLQNLVRHVGLCEILGRMAKYINAPARARQPRRRWQLVEDVRVQLTQWRDSLPDHMARMLRGERFPPNPPPAAGEDRDQSAPYDPRSVEALWGVHHHLICHYHGAEILLNRLVAGRYDERCERSAVAVTEVLDRLPLTLSGTTVVAEEMMAAKEAARAAKGLSNQLHERKKRKAGNDAVMRRLGRKREAVAAAAAAAARAQIFRRRDLEAAGLGVDTAFLASEDDEEEEEAASEDENEDDTMEEEDDEGMTCGEGADDDEDNELNDDPPFIFIEPTIVYSALAATGVFLDMIVKNYKEEADAGHSVKLSTLRGSESFTRAVLAFDRLRQTSMYSLYYKYLMIECVRLPNMDLDVSGLGVNPMTGKGGVQDSAAQEAAAAAADLAERERAMANGVAGSDNLSEGSPVVDASKAAEASTSSGSKRPTVLDAYGSSRSIIPDEEAAKAAPGAPGAGVAGGAMVAGRTTTSAGLPLIAGADESSPVVGMKRSRSGGGKRRKSPADGEEMNDSVGAGGDSARAAVDVRMDKQETQQLHDGKSVVRLGASAAVSTTTSRSTGIAPTLVMIVTDDNSLSGMGEDLEELPAGEAMAKQDANDILHGLSAMNDIPIGTVENSQNGAQSNEQLQALGSDMKLAFPTEWEVGADALSTYEMVREQARKLQRHRQEMEELKQQHAEKQRAVLHSLLGSTFLDVNKANPLANTTKVEASGKGDRARQNPGEPKMYRSLKESVASVQGLRMGTPNVNSKSKGRGARDPSLTPPGGNDGSASSLGSRSSSSSSGRPADVFLNMHSMVSTAFRGSMSPNDPASAQWPQPTCLPGPLLPEGSVPGSAADLNLTAGFGVEFSGDAHPHFGTDQYMQLLSALGGSNGAGGWIPSAGPGSIDPATEWMASQAPSSSEFATQQQQGMWFPAVEAGKVPTMQSNFSASSSHMPVDVPEQAHFALFQQQQQQHHQHTLQGQQQFINGQLFGAQGQWVEGGAEGNLVNPTPGSDGAVDQSASGWFFAGY
ncbi:fungal-specific transcription factor domain-containing protein [Cladochytrium replicatum]|nr:fungal-specific transcription factor domain-containing protein [Cladochytrium replicatum]